MQKLKLSLENCFGIKKLEKEFSFSNSNVNVIYARNGMMKTSLTKTFEKIQKNKDAEICDKIFNQEPVIKQVKVDGENIDPEHIFVINSYESNYESNNITALLINEEIKDRLKSLLEIRTDFLKKLEGLSSLKIAKISNGKKIYELEECLIQDLECDQNSFLMSLNSININENDYDFSHISYADIYDASLIEKIKTDDFQNSINDFLNKSDEIYSQYNFLDKGNFTLPKLKKIQKELNKNSFFVKENKIKLANEENIECIEDLKNKIREIDELVVETSEFKKIQKILSTVKGMKLKEIIENNPEIINELRINNLENFKKKLWKSYFKKEDETFYELKIKFNELQSEIDNTDIERTPWVNALEIFNERFTVPFKMEIKNKISSIIGESLPRVIFRFYRDGNFDNNESSNWESINREDLESKNTLSQGEKRALYLLNIIFDIEKRKQDSEKTLFIIDDIADSFDYKNKYAIIEYLKEISDYNGFYMLILSHNFDFYRTVSSRLSMKRENKFIARLEDENIKIIQERYQNKPFIHWRNNLNKKFTIALIPFTRNIIEYGKDREKNNHPNISNDFDFMTNLIHIKEYTEVINVGQLKTIFEEYLGNDDFLNGISDEETIYKIIEEESENIDYSDIYLENKIILAISIRLKSEKFMMDKLDDDNIYDEITQNQTRELFNRYKVNGDEQSKKVLNEVMIMIPENIHFNSFMYEPLMDMDIVEILNLYYKVREL